MSKIRIMTHNLWKKDKNTPAWEAKGYDCSAEVRSKGFIRLYGELMPDLIGCQEASPLMAELILSGCRANGQKYAILEGGDTPIFYSSEKLDLVDSFFSLYPEEIPGLEGTFNNNKTKSMNLAVFRIKENNQFLIFATTHLWWKNSDPTAKNYQPYSDEARAYQLGLLIEKINDYEGKYNCPCVIVGDLNAGYDSKCVQSALKCGFSHAHDIATSSDDRVGLHYCFADGFKNEYYDYPFEKAIDHILIGRKSDMEVLRFQRYSPEYYFPLSDHSPAFVDVEI